MNLDNFLSVLQSRVRMAYPRSANERHAASPMWNQPAHSAAPFLATSIPNLVAKSLEDQSLPRHCMALVSACRKSGAGYLVHVLQAGSLQIRTFMPTSNAGNRRLLKHAVAHETLNITLDIEETTHSLEMLTVLDRESALAALAVPQVPASEAVVVDEALALLALSAVPNIRSLAPGERVLDVLVAYAGDTESIVRSRQSDSMGEALGEHGPIH